MATGDRKTSVVWEYFTVAEDTKFAVCGECQTRGGTTTKSFTTTNLVHHLSVKHPEIHANYLERKVNQEPRQPKDMRKRSLHCQLSLTETQELTKVWDINDHRAQRVHHKIGEMSIVTHFHRSSIASHNLKRIQQSLDLPQHKLKQDITTR